MGIFRRSTTATVTSTSPPTAPPVPVEARRQSTASDRAWSAGSAVVLRPHLTEKTSRLSEIGQYTFAVRANAEKVAVARAIAERYGVHPVRVTITRLPGKIVRHGKSTGRRSSLKKAIVTLRSGETIPFGVKS